MAGIVVDLHFDLLPKLLERLLEFANVVERDAVILTAEQPNPSVTYPWSARFEACSFTQSVQAPIFRDHDQTRKRSLACRGVQNALDRFVAALVGDLRAVGSDCRNSEQ